MPSALVQVQQPVEQALASGLVRGNAGAAAIQPQASLGMRQMQPHMHRLARTGKAQVEIGSGIARQHRVGQRLIACKVGRRRRAL